MFLNMAALAIAAATLVLIVSGFVARHRLAVMTNVEVHASPGSRGWLLRFVQPYRSALAISFLLVMTSTVVSLAAPWPLKVMIDNAINGEPLPSQLSALDSLSPTMLTFVAAATGLGLVLLNVLLGYLVTYLVGATEVRIASDMRAAVFRRLQDLSLTFHDRNRTGDLVSRLTTDVAQVRDVIVAWFDRVLPDVLTLLGILVIMLIVSPTLTLVALSVVPLLLYYAYVKRPKIRAAQREARDRRGELASQATDALRNVRVVQMFSRQADETDRFRRQLDRTADADITSLDVSAKYTPISSIVLGLGTALVSWIGVVKVIDGELSLGTLLVVLAYLSGLYSPIRSLSRTVSTFARGAASRDRLLELFSEEHLVVEHPEAIDAPEGAATLAVDRLSFEYKTDAPVLRDLSLTIDPGSSVCVVGASGAGKSTLLSLFLRLYEPTAGRITLDDTDVRRIRLASLRESIALVPQDPWMLDGTIGENIRFGERGASGASVLDAARAVGVAGFAEALPDGYDTPVGEGGILLSGGQRRRIALARALVRDAQILLLDEPTAGLDATAADAVLDAVVAASEGRTTVVVSHDLSVATRTSRVVVLEDGAITEDGDHTTLLALGGRYAWLWALQQQARDNPGREEVKTS